MWGEDCQPVEVTPPGHVVSAVKLGGNCQGPRHSQLVISVMSIRILSPRPVSPHLLISQELIFLLIFLGE